MIVVSGSSPNPTSNGVGIDDHTDLARYQPGGLVDPDFGDGGTVRLDAFVGAGLAIQPDGRLVLVGTVDTTPPTSPPGTFTDIAVMRLNPDGIPDESFGEHGGVHFSASALTSPFGPGRDTGHDVALQADGRIVVVGNTGPLNADFAVARLLPDGTLDTEFTDTGVMSIGFSHLTDIAENVAITPDGKIVVSAGRAAPETATASSASHPSSPRPEPGTRSRRSGDQRARLTIKAERLLIAKPKENSGAS